MGGVGNEGAVAGGEEGPEGIRALDGEVGVVGEEVGDYVFVFRAGEGAGGVDETAAGGADVGGELGENVVLGGAGGGEVGGRGRPLKVGGAAPGAGAGAGGVDEDAVVKRLSGGRASGGRDGDIGEAGALGAGGEFAEGGGANIVGGDAAGGAEEAGELQGFAAGAGAGVEPVAAGGEVGGGEDELGAKVLDLDEAVAVGGGRGNGGIGRETPSDGENGGGFRGPTEGGEFGGDGAGVSVWRRSQRVARERRAVRWAGSAARVGEAASNQAGRRGERLAVATRSGRAKAARKAWVEGVSADSAAMRPMASAGEAFSIQGRMRSAV